MGAPDRSRLRDRFPARWAPLALVPVLVAVGSLSFHTYDTRRYLVAVRAVREGTPLYAAPDVAYPPLAYWVMTVATAPAAWVEGGVEPTPAVVGSLVALFVGALAVGAAYGAAELPAGRGTRFLAFALLNPLTLSGVVVWTQADGLVALGVVVAVVAFARGRPATFGAAVAAGAAVKLWPALMLVPVLARGELDRRRVLAGVAPVGALSALAVLAHHPSSTAALLDPATAAGIRTPAYPPTNVVRGVGLVLGVAVPPAVASAVFWVGTAAATAWSVRRRVRPAALGPLVPTLPLVFLYPAAFPYRWLPALLALAWVGHHAAGTARARRLRQFAVLDAVVGTAILGAFVLAGSHAARFELVGTVRPLVDYQGLLPPVAPESLQFGAMAVLGVAHVCAGAWAFAPTPTADPTHSPASGAAGTDPEAESGTDSGTGSGRR